MNKGVDLIQRQQLEFIEGFPTGNIYIGVTGEELEELEKELKVLEIIKDKLVNVWILVISNNVDVYNASIHHNMIKPLTQEEYDLLKEVIFNEQRH